MKKLLSIILLLTLSFTFSACGGSDDDEPEKFVWGGDWNNPSDPNYKAEYGGKYNPIQGLWRADWDKEEGIYFSEDFKVYSVIFYPNGLYKKELFRDKYIINDKAFTYVPHEIWRYKIENNKLANTYYLNEDKVWSYFTKVEE